MKIVLLLFLIVFPTHGALSQTVIFHSQPDQDLATKWSSSLRQGRELDSDFWIGYSFQRLMGESEYVGSNIRFDGGTMTGTFRGNVGPDSFIGKPLIELLKERPTTFQKDSKKKVMKRIAILHLVRVKNGKPIVQLIEFGNVDLPFELRSLPLVWLGETDARQSFDHLTKNFETSAKELKKWIVYAIGLHPLPEQVVGFAKGIIADKSLDNELRKAAVYSLSDQENQGVVSFLKQLALTEADEEVAKAACYTLGDIHNSGSSQALTTIVRQAPKIEARKAALYAIAGHRDEHAKQLLLSVVTSDASEELSKAALYALADLLEPNGAEVIYDVQRNAKSSEVKKAAIYALADIEGPDTLDMLTKILKTEADPELRKATVYALAAIESDKTINVLLNVVAYDKDREIRKAAIYALGDMDSPKAKAALIEILKK